MYTHRHTDEITPLVGRFLNHLRDRRHLSPYTCHAYGVDLIMFGYYLAGPKSLSSEEIDALLLNCTTDVARAFIEHLRKEGKRNSTVCRKFSAMRAFYKYLVRENLAGVNPFNSTFAPRQRHAVPKVIDAEQVEKLLSAPKKEGFKGLRDRAILELLYSTGIKTTELVNLKVPDLDLKDGTIRLCTSNHPPRLRMIPLRAALAIDAYLIVRSVAGFTDSHAFVNKFGKPISTRGIRRCVDRYLERVGLDRGLSPTTLRHSYAVHMLAKGMDRRVLRQLLGHRPSTSMQKYVQILKTQQQEQPAAIAA
jgi:site-specific recombinase XerD